MRLSVYNRFQLEVIREDGCWVIYVLAEGTQTLLKELVPPAHFSAEEVVAYVDDLYHEKARPGESIVVLD